MGTGIMVCGLNGCGKSTLGRALAKELDFNFIDNECLFFSRKSETEPYINPKSRDEAIKLLMDEVHKHSDFVFAAVKGDYGKEILPLYDYIIEINVPKDIRLQRVRDRSYQKFGNRMLVGGDLYESEERFFNFVESRPDNYVEKWVRTLNCPVIKVDGTKSIEYNIAFILKQIHK